MFAHRRALQALINTSAERFFVFEDDVTLPDEPIERTRAAAAEFVATSRGQDLAYLGHCFDGLCTHALLWSRAGALKALERVQWCSAEPVDEQLRRLCWGKALTCVLAPNARVTANTWGDGLLHQWAKACGDPYQCAALKIAGKAELDGKIAMLARGREADWLAMHTVG